MFVKKVIKDTVPKKEYEITLPYLGPLSNKIHRRIKNVFQKVLSAGKIRIVYKTTHRLSHLFRFKDLVHCDLRSHVIYRFKDLVPCDLRSHVIYRFKDLVPCDLRSHVIYQFKCPSCNNGFIGETRVHFKVRSCQHLGITFFR